MTTFSPLIGRMCLGQECKHRKQVQISRLRTRLSESRSDLDPLCSQLLTSAGSSEQSSPHRRVTSRSGPIPRPLCCVQISPNKSHRGWKSNQSLNGLTEATLQSEARRLPTERVQTRSSVLELGPCGGGPARPSWPQRLTYSYHMLLIISVGSWMNVLLKRFLSQVRNID